MYFFLTGSSLRRQVKKQIQSDHAELLPGKLSYMRRFFSYISQRNKWWLVLILVLIILFTVTFSRIGFLSFIHFEDKTAAILIDQRTANVATIISMTLAVIALLLGNLAIKDSQILKLLFVKSRLYLILYYTLSVICCLMLISTLRDTIDDEIFERMVIAATYMALLILFGIGFLFRTIITFANAGNIHKILEDQLLMEAKSNLRVQLMSKLSRETFLETMREHNVEHSPTNFVFNVGGPVGNIEHEPRLIYDVNLKRLKEQLTRDVNGQPRLFSTAMAINTISGHYKDFILPNPVNRRGKQMKLTSCVRIKDKKSLIVHVDEFKNYFDKKLIEYSIEGKHIKVAELLALYLALYELEMKHT